MRTIISIIILFTLICQVYGQADSTSVYKNLKSKKFYSVGLFSETRKGKITYNVNDKIVSKSTYKKYKSKWKNMETCCPCILKSYDENDNLIKESVSCTDCGVGWFKTYYKNGIVKLSGSYKENPTGDWNDIWNRGYCSVPDGEWTFFDQNGDTLFSEFWSNGQFIKQYPEQDSIEVWETELHLNGEKYEFQKINFEEISDLKIVAKFKNGHTSNNFRIEVKVPTNYYVKFKSSTTPDPFQEINAMKIFEDANVPEVKRTSLEILVYLDDNFIDSFIILFKL